ncbi:aldehyde dehydrogenase domain protein [Mycobacteroides abscessus]|nr:aldehyde dehydrogenase domain protein [Mycobacteroides abscessus]
MELPLHDGDLEDRPALAAGNTVVLKPATPPRRALWYWRG